MSAGGALARVDDPAVGRRRSAVSLGRKIEVLGVAGAGKSTLVRVLGERTGCQTAGFIHARRPAHLLQIVRGIPRLLPILATGSARRPRMTWREWKLLTYVSRWQHVLDRGAPPKGAALLFDQGPLYALVRLQAEAKPFTARPAFERWRDEMLERWASELEAVVWLDAPDAVLWSRINQRPQAHGTKGEEAGSGHRFIVRYRRSFEDLLHRLDGSRGPRVLRFDTSAMTAERIAEAVGSQLRLSPGTARAVRTVHGPEDGRQEDPDGP